MCAELLGKFHVEEGIHKNSLGLAASLDYSELDRSHQ